MSVGHAVLLSSFSVPQISYCFSTAFCFSSANFLQTQHCKYYFFPGAVILFLKCIFIFAGEEGEVTTSHLLLGIWAQKESAGHKVLASLGVTDDLMEQLASSVRTSLINRLS